MSAKKRVTIYFEAPLHRALRRKSAETGASISDLVSEAVRQSLAEDAADLAVFDDRAHEPRVSFEFAVRTERR